MRRFDEAVEFVLKNRNKRAEERRVYGFTRDFFANEPLKEEIREQMNTLVEKVVSGELKLDDAILDAAVENLILGVAIGVEMERQEIPRPGASLMLAIWRNVTSGMALVAASRYLDPMFVQLPVSRAEPRHH